MTLLKAEEDEDGRRSGALRWPAQIGKIITSTQLFSRM